MSDINETVSELLADPQVSSIESIWLYALDDDRGSRTCLHVEYLAGPKPFLRLWVNKGDGTPPSTEWSHYLPDDAICIYERPDA